MYLVLYILCVCVCMCIYIYTYIYIYIHSYRILPPAASLDTPALSARCWVLRLDTPAFETLRIDPDCLLGVGPEISVWIISAFQNFCELASRWRIQLVLLSSLPWQNRSCFRIMKNSLQCLRSGKDWLARWLAFSTAGLGVSVPRKTPRSIQQMLTSQNGKAYAQGVQTTWIFKFRATWIKSRYVRDCHGMSR